MNWVGRASTNQALSFKKKKKKKQNKQEIYSERT